MRRVIASVIAALAVATTALAADITGKWVGNVDTPNGIAGDTLTYDVQIETGKITHEAKVNADGTEIAIKATGDWGTAEYVVKKVVAP